VTGRYAHTTIMPTHTNRVASARPDSRDPSPPAALRPPIPTPRGTTAVAVSCIG